MKNMKIKNILGIMLGIFALAFCSVSKAEMYLLTSGYVMTYNSGSHTIVGDPEYGIHDEDYDMAGASYYAYVDDETGYINVYWQYVSYYKLWVSPTNYIFVQNYGTVSRSYFGYYAEFVAWDNPEGHYLWTLDNNMADLAQYIVELSLYNWYWN